MYNPADHEPMGDFSILPEGLYQVAIIDADWKQTKAGNGHYLSLQFEILKGEKTGRQLWTNLNLDNPNDKAVQIANRELRSICDALGVVEAFDPTTDAGHMMLIHKPMVIKLAVKARRDNGELENRIVAYAQGDTPAPTQQTIDTDDNLPF